MLYYVLFDHNFKKNIWIIMLFSIFRENNTKVAIKNLTHSKDFEIECMTFHI